MLQLAEFPRGPDSGAEGPGQTSQASLGGHFRLRKRPPVLEQPKTASGLRGVLLPEAEGEEAGGTLDRPIGKGTYLCAQRERSGPWVDRSGGWENGEERVHVTGSRRAFGERCGVLARVMAG